MGRQDIPLSLFAAEDAKTVRRIDLPAALPRDIATNSERLFVLGKRRSRRRVEAIIFATEDRCTLFQRQNLRPAKPREADCHHAFGTLYISSASSKVIISLTQVTGILRQVSF